MLSIAWTAAAAGHGLAFTKLEPPKLLPVNQAFKVSEIYRDGHHLRLAWAIAPAYFLYPRRIRVTLRGSSKPLHLRLPRGQRYKEPGSGMIEVYRDNVKVTVSLPPRLRTENLTVRYQGCSELGICYPPQVQTITLKNVARVPTDNK